MDGSKTYHHGDLRAALLKAGEEELAERGPEAFSLRSVARRAGVSHAAPAHHFGDVRGLLTALAAQGFHRLLEAQDARLACVPDADAAERLMVQGLGYIDFACDHLALFKICFGSTYPDREDEALAEVGQAAFDRLAQSVAAVTGRAAYGPPEHMADTFRVWALTHGLADLLAAKHAPPLAAMEPAAREEMLRCLLAGVIPGPDAAEGAAPSGQRPAGD